MCDSRLTATVTLTPRGGIPLLRPTGEPTATAARHPLRVLYLSWRDRENPEAGGSETFVERTSQVLTELGHDVTLFTSRFPGAATETAHDDVRVLRRGNRFTCYAHGLAHVARHRHDYDIVIDVQNGVPFWAPLAAKAPVVNVVHHVHRDQWKVIFGRALGQVGWLLESRIAPRVYRRSRYVTVSKATRDDLGSLGVPADRVDLIYSGNDHPEDLDAYADVPRTPHPSMVVLGRLVPHKQVETAIDIVADLSAEHPDLRLDIVGTGYWEDRLRAHAADRGVADRVTFRGFVDEPTKHTLLAQSWLMLVPSHKEGWGLIIVEAGLHSTPSVAFAHAGGPSESIQHGRTGLLARDAAEMTHQVDHLLRSNSLRTRLGAGARAHARSFDWAVSGALLSHTLGSVLGHVDRLPQAPSQPLSLTPVEDLVHEPEHRAGHENDALLPVVDEALLDELDGLGSGSLQGTH
ncbi:glycosyltransferase family 4 protein [Luteipulveratus halotolerans]|uniref:glycosyltransferase family 4 protein n=1 Tax=Luteipulveratus halotolerans TaxID=1631356 RepID=UPI0009E18E16|nr:glycosyltransferase family 4 protein [Luteipulveratus halotolerans]